MVRGGCVSHDRPAWVVVYFNYRSKMMTQLELDCAVAEATGETLHDVRRMGFSLADPLEVNFDPEPYLPPPVDEISKYIDWDNLDAERNAVVPQPLSSLRWVA
jgi:hypothetical protein